MILSLRFETTLLLDFGLVCKQLSISALLVEILDLNVRLFRLNVMNAEIVALEYRIVAVKYFSKCLQAVAVATS